jgi:hypothetical protein
MTNEGPTGGEPADDPPPQAAANTARPAKVPLPPAVTTDPVARPAKVPLPPAIHPEGQPLPPDAPPMPSQPPRVKQPLPPMTPDAPPDPDGPEGDREGREWWRTADVRDELRDDWENTGREGLQAAYEIGAQIGEAVAAHLPDPYAAAQRRGLDLRWLHLGINIPALAVSLLVTWGGQSPADHLTGYAAREGLFAPLGWVLLPALVLAVLMVLPGGVLLGGLISGAARGVVALLRRAWAVPLAGYVLRLAVATAGWSFVVAAGHLTGRAAINWLTGV